MKSLILIWLTFFSLILSAQNSYEVKPKAETHKDYEKTPTEEEKFISDNFPFTHMADWKPGMRFMVEPDKYGTGKLRLGKYKKGGSYSSGLPQKDYQGKTFTVVNLEEREVSCPRGRCTRTYVILECEGAKFECEYIGSLDEMRQKDVFTTIDKLIYIDEIDKARALLVGKKLYFLSDPLVTLKYFPVTITNVGMGSTLLSSPIRIIYADESGSEAYVEIKLSGTNSDSRSGKQFQDVFSFENPRKLHSDISDETWSLIQTGKVKIGMTEKECELSWGRPRKINTTVTTSGKQQQWVYSTTSYLYFDGGKLTSIQN